MSGAASGDSVLFHYTGKLEDGTVFDSSEERDPLQTKVGSRQVIQGVDQALVGMAPGDSKTVTIAAQEAYGPRRPELVLEVERERLAPDMEVSVGDRLEGSDDQGRRMQLLVVGVDEESVRVDANHPLAGEDLTFELTLVKVV